MNENKPAQTELIVSSKRDDRQLARVDEPRQELNIGELVRAVVEKGVTQENAAAVKELLGVYVTMEDRNAERQFNIAFVELQKEIPKVRAIKTVPNNDGSPRYTFAPFEEIDDQARPVCLAHGFTYTFSEGEERPGKITKVCTLAHIGGHKRSNSYSVRVGKGPPGSSESQSDGAAHSYAKRGALCDALNIRIDKAFNPDHDPRNEGAMITKEQAAALEEQMLKVGADRDKFLKFAGANLSAPNPWLTIPSSRLEELVRMLAKKELLKGQK